VDRVPRERMAVKHEWPMRAAVPQDNGGAVAMHDGAVDNRTMPDRPVDNRTMPDRSVDNRTMPDRPVDNRRMLVDCRVRDGMGLMDRSPRGALAFAMFGAGRLGEGHCG